MGSVAPPRPSDDVTVGLPDAPSYAGAVDIAGGLLAAADADADEMADRLHDGVVQALVVARYAADGAVRGGDPIAARDAVQAALVELRRALWHLRPRGHGDGGLAEALRQLSGRIEESGGTPLGLHLDEDTAAALPVAAASVGYRLVQAAAASPGAGPVGVRIRQDGLDAVLEVEGGAALEHGRWSAKAHALGGRLTQNQGRLRLVVPLSPATKAKP